jgi:hypothetical protein
MAMADTKINRSTGAEPAAATSPKTAVDGATGLSEEVLESVEAGQRAAIEAVRMFVGTVDHALPVDSSRRQGVVDSALEMADRLVQSQHDFIRKVISSAGKAL